MDRKLKMSDFFIFEIKRAKTDEIFNFLKDRFSITSGPMEIIFGVFSETNKNLLQNMISPLLSKHSKIYSILNSKSCL